MLRSAITTVSLLLLTCVAIADGAPEHNARAQTESYIVQADSLEAAVSAVTKVGGEITHRLGIINAVGAELSAVQYGKLATDKRVRVQKDRQAGVSAVSLQPVTMTLRRSAPVKGSGPSTFYPSLVGASMMHQKGATGEGVTVAVVDTGYFDTRYLERKSDGNVRVVAQYDALQDRTAGQTALAVDNAVGVAQDQNGHGSHVISVIANSERDKDGNYMGVAPGVSLVSVKAFDRYGNGSYLDVIRGLDWLYNVRKQYDIRVVNLSFSAEPQSHYWDDPINQAVMKLWQAGLVVVASAGNKGPDPMTIGVPGNVPYVITVGAMTDEGTPYFGEDDRLATFSSAGPTVEGFVKPDVVAPGGNVIGLMNNGAHQITIDHPEFMFSHGDSDDYFTMSGTSQSAAVVSGVVALLLDLFPTLTNDEIKCRLVSGALPALDDDGNLAYSVFQQGAGLVHAYSAAKQSSDDCANVGMDIAADLAGKVHYGGRANVDEGGNYYVMDLDGYLWTDGKLATGGYLWTDGYIWTDGYMWTDSYLWTDGSVGANGYMWTDGYIWTDAYMWTDGYMWTDSYLWTDRATQSAGINDWVDPE